MLYKGQTHVAGQANNSYVFPGIGLGVIVSHTQLITDEMFLTAAKTLASLVEERDLEQGRIFPPLTQIRQISAHIAAAIWRTAANTGIVCEPVPENVIDYIHGQMYEPQYPSYL